MRTFQPGLRYLSVFEEPFQNELFGDGYVGESDIGQAD